MKNGGLDRDPPNQPVLVVQVSAGLHAWHSTLESGWMWGGGGCRGCGARAGAEARESRRLCNPECRAEPDPAVPTLMSRGDGGRRKGHTKLLGSLRQFVAEQRMRL